MVINAVQWYVEKLLVQGFRVKVAHTWVFEIFLKLWYLETFKEESNDIQIANYYDLCIHFYSYT